MRTDLASPSINYILRQKHHLEMKFELFLEDLIQVSERDHYRLKPRQHTLLCFSTDMNEMLTH